ncbi:MAG: hypothetical protein ABSE17_02695 [Candidatus Levyibacteriota bacterium]|jgi:hypothetical protein
MADERYRGGKVTAACFGNCPNLQPLLKAAFMDDAHFAPTEGLVRIPNGRCLEKIEIWKRNAGGCSGPERKTSAGTAGETIFVCPVAATTSMPKL